MQRHYLLILTTLAVLGSFSHATLAESIPSEFHGKWGDANCLNSGDPGTDEPGRPEIEVKAKRISFMDMSCTLKRAASKKSDALESNSFTGKFVCDIEGEIVNNTTFTFTLNNQRLSFSSNIENLTENYGFGENSNINLKRCH